MYGTAPPRRRDGEPSRSAGLLGVRSDAFLWMAVGSMAVSATMQMMGNTHVRL